MLIYKITSKCSRCLKPPDVDLKETDLGAEKEGELKTEKEQKNFISGPMWHLTV